MPNLQTVIPISEDQALDVLGQALDRQYTRFGEGDAVRLNKRAAPRPGDIASSGGPGDDPFDPSLPHYPAEEMPDGLRAALKRGTVGLISEYHGHAPWQGRGREQDIYQVLLLGQNGHIYSVALPDCALMAYEPRPPQGLCQPAAEAPAPSLDDFAEAVRQHDGATGRLLKGRKLRVVEA